MSTFRRETSPAKGTTRKPNIGPAAFGHATCAGNETGKMTCRNPSEGYSMFGFKVGICDFLPGNCQAYYNCAGYYLYCNFLLPVLCSMLTA